MPTDLLQLTTAFSGLQLIVVVYVLMELRHLSAAQVKHAAQSEAQAAQITALSLQLATLSGRLHNEKDDGR